MGIWGGGEVGRMWGGGERDVGRWRGGDVGRGEMGKWGEDVLIILLHSPEHPQAVIVEGIPELWPHSAVVPLSYLLVDLWVSEE